MITKEQVQPFIDGAKSVVDVTAGMTTELIAEAINLFILEGVLSVLKFAAVFIIYAIIRKYLTALPAEMEQAKRAGLTITLCGSIIFFTVKSYPHLVDISKAMVAPKIFLIEKGAQLIRRGE